MFIIIYMITSRFSRLFSLVGQGIHYSFTDLLNMQGIKRKEQMRLNCEKAVWASKVIYAINDAKPDNNRDIKEPSLREQILNLTIQDFDYSQESKNAVLKMFKQGIPLNQKLFNKTSILHGKQGASERPKQTKDLPFIFCPSMLVTTDVFRILLDKRWNSMISEGQGIGKSTSIILLHHLSSIVNKYMYSAFADPQEQSYLKDLLKKRLIIYVPKFFYWHMSFQGQNYNIQTETTVKQILLLQAIELSDKQRIKLQLINSLEKFAFQLNRTYEEKNITTKAIVDNLSFCAFLMRKWNLFVDNSKRKKYQYQNIIKYFKLKSQIEKDETYKNYMEKYRQYKQQEQKQWKQINFKQQRQNYELIFKPARNIEELMHNVRKTSQMTFFNNSITIEHSLLTDRIHYNLISFGLTDHDQMWKQYVPFSQHLIAQWGQNDFNHYFWFQIQKRLAAKGYNFTQLQKLKLIFYDKAKETKAHISCPFSNIRKLFQENPSLLNFTNEITDHQIGNKFEQIIHILKVYSLEYFTKKIDDFLRKIGVRDYFKTQKEITIMLHDKAVEQIQKARGYRYMMATIKDTSDKSEIKAAAREFFTQNSYDEQFKQPIILSDNWNIIFPWTNREYLEVHQIHSIKQKFPNLTTLQALQLHIKWRDDMGKYLKHYLIQVLTLPGTIFKFVQYISGTVMSRFIVHSQSTFLSFQRKALNFNVNFSELIILAKDSPGNISLPYRSIANRNKNKVKMRKCILGNLTKTIRRQILLFSHAKYNNKSQFTSSLSLFKQVWPQKRKLFKKEFNKQKKYLCR